MAAPMLKISNFLHGYKSIAISDDLTIAVGSEKFIHFFRVTCKTSDISESFVLHRSVVEYDDTYHYPSTGLSKKDIKSELKEYFDKNCDAGATFHIDGTIGAPNGSSSPYFQHSRPRCLCWSLKGCSAKDGPVLAFLQTDHKMRLYAETKKNKWTEVADISSMLHEYIQSMKYNIKKVSGENNSIVKMAINRFAMISIENMCWSGVYKEQLENKEQTYTMLVTYCRDGLFVFWKCLVPIISKNCISICGLMDTGITSPSSVKWYQKAEKIENSLLAIGTNDGQIQVWNLNFDATKKPESRVTIVKQLELWESDLIVVSCFYWSTFPEEKNLKRLVSVKGQYVLVFDLQINKNGTINIVRKGYTHALHTSEITGITHHDNVITVVSQTLMKQKIVIKVEGSSLILSPTVVETSQTRTKNSHGTVFSPNGAFSVEISKNIKRTVKRSMSQCLFAQWEMKPEKLKDCILNPKTDIEIAKRLDYLEYLRQSIVNGMEFELPDINDCTDNDHYKYFRQLHLFNLKLQTSCAKQRPHKFGEEEHYNQAIENFVAKAKNITETLLADHLVDSLQLWQGSEKNQTQTDTSAIYLALKWLNACEALNEKPRKFVFELYELFKNRYPEIKPEETCCLCLNDIPFTSIFEDECSNNHKWRRCSQSLRLCQRSLTNYCEICGAISLKSKEDNWSNAVLRTSCLYCGGCMVSW